MCVGCRHPIQTAKVKNGLLLIIQSIKSEITLSLLTVGVVCRGLIHWYLGSQFTPRESCLEGQIPNLVGCLLSIPVRDYFYFRDQCLRLKWKVMEALKSSPLNRKRELIAPLSEASQRHCSSCGSLLMRGLTRVNFLEGRIYRNHS